MISTKKWNTVKPNTKSNFEAVNLNEKVKKLNKSILKKIESIYKNGKNYKTW